MADRATPKPERSCAISPRWQIAGAAVTAEGVPALGLQRLLDDQPRRQLHQSGAAVG